MLKNWKDFRKVQNSVLSPEAWLKRLDVEFGGHSLTVYKHIHSRH